jgi:basic membrane protein A
LAGLVERRTGARPAVGSVGGLKVAQIDRFIAGYQAGARRAAPGIATLNGYAGGFLASQRAKCRNVALAQIARGAGIIFPVAGACGLGALRAAEQKGVWGIGVDVDQSSLGRHILTSAVKHVDAAIFETVRAAQRNRLALGTTTVLGVREGAVGLARISPRVPRALVSKVERVRGLIASGRLRDIPTTLR